MSEINAKTDLGPIRRAFDLPKQFPLPSVQISFSFPSSLMPPVSRIHHALLQLALAEVRLGPGSGASFPLRSPPRARSALFQAAPVSLSPALRCEVSLVLAVFLQP